MKIGARWVTTLLAVLLCTPALAYAMPGQFVARQYTEALGQAPNAGSWQSAASAFAGSGCSQASLKAYGSALYVSAAYDGLGYSNRERVITAYRGILAREPDSAGFTSALAFLDGGGAWATLVDSLYDGAEFAALVPVYCSGGSAGAGTLAAFEVPGLVESTESLQARLNAASPSETVTIQQNWLTRLTATLVVPAGVTLQTAGTVSASEYAKMGRLVRGASFDGPLVDLRSGAKLVNVWVSGERHIVGFSSARINVQLQGSGTQVVGVKSETSAGWSNIVTLGTAEGTPCSAQLVADSLVTNYSGTHESEPTDGISVACESTTVQGNHVVDASDVGIVLFSAGAAAQTSVTSGNRIIAAGVSAYAALTLYPGIEGGSFSGSSMTANELWSSPAQHFDIGIAIGSSPWVGDLGQLGSGASVTNNGTAGIATGLDAALTLDGMVNATVLGNTFARVAVEVSDCPSGLVLADVAGGHASGTLQPSEQANAHACLGHNGGLLVKSSPRRAGALMAKLTPSVKSWTTSSTTTDPPGTYTAVHRGGICAADESGACVGADASTASGGTLIGYARVVGSGIPLYAGSCYANEASCTGWGLSTNEGTDFVAYAMTTPPAGTAVPLVDSGGLLYHGLTGPATVYLWPTPPETTTVTSHVDHFYSSDGSMPAGYAATTGPVYVLKDAAAGTAPLRRFVNATTGHHFYAKTTSAPAGFTEQAVLGHVQVAAGGGFVALYLHHNASTGDYVLTSSATPPSGYQMQTLIGYGLGGA